MILFYLLISSIAQINAGDPTQHLSALLKHTQLQFKSFFATTNTRQLLEEISRHDIQCHKKPLFGSKILLKSNKKLLKRISQSDLDFKAACDSSSMLLNYVIWGLPDRVLFALNEGFSPNVTDENKDTPIMWALEQYAINKRSSDYEIDPIKKEQKRIAFTQIIEELLHHGSIIFGNSKYNCPYTFAKKHQLYEFLLLFSTIQTRRIQKISKYYQEQGYEKKDADIMSHQIISENTDLMGLSSQERNELIVKNLYYHWFDKQMFQDSARNNHLQQLESLNQ